MTRNEYRHLYRSCLAKVKYNTEESAMAALRSMVLRGLSGRRGHDLHTYRCEACRKYHLGNITRGQYLARILPLYREISEGQRDWWPLHEAYFTMDLKKKRRAAVDAEGSHKKALPDLSDNSLNDQSQRLPASHRL